MVTALQSNIKSITILIKERDLASVKAILNFLKEKYPKFSAMKFRTGELGQDILVSFKVKNEFYPKVLEKFAYNDIPLITKDKDSQDYVKEKKEVKRKKLRAQGWSEISVSKQQVTINELNKFSEQGKIKEIVKEAKGGVRSNIEIVKKAKHLLSPTINIAIENLTSYAEERIGKREDTIEELMLIATDKDLKLFHKYEDQRKAGLTAIEISLSHKNYHSYLIKIANHSKLNHLTNIKAMLALANLYKESKEDNVDTIKLLNTRWMKIAFETIQQKLTPEEKEEFNSFINFVEDERKAA